MMTVYIEPEMLNILKSGNYVLCIAKKVNDSYTVVWKGIKDILRKNYFEWEPKYEIFGTNSFSSGLLVKATTTAQRIQGLQNCTLSPNGILSTATGTIDSSKPFCMKNEFGTIYPGVNIIQPDGEHLPIYVAPAPSIKGDVSLLPKEEVRIWLEQNITTGTMISEVRSNHIDMDFTEESELAVEFLNDQMWYQK